MEFRERMLYEIESPLLSLPGALKGSDDMYSVIKVIMGKDKTINSKS